MPKRRAPTSPSAGRPTGPAGSSDSRRRSGRGRLIGTLGVLSLVLLAGVVSLAMAPRDPGSTSTNGWTGPEHAADDGSPDVLAPSVASAPRPRAPGQPITIDASFDSSSTPEDSPAPIGSAPPLAAPAPTTTVATTTTTTTTTTTMTTTTTTTVTPATTVATSAVTAVDDAFTLTKTGSASLPVTDNDVVGADPVTVTIVDDPQHGTAAANGLTVKYRPYANGTGSDVFTYELCSADAACDRAIVTVTLDLVRR